MKCDTLQTAMSTMSALWGPLSTELVEAARAQIAALAKASPAEQWLSDLYQDQPSTRELYRDALHGFVLLAHFEKTGLYRPPHDHGRNWVVYAVHSGESEMGTYARATDPEGKTRLVKRNATLVKPGEVQVYLPGDIHDTLCVSGPALLFRFTERDLRQDDVAEHRVTRYVERQGIWTTATP